MAEYIEREAAVLALLDGQGVQKRIVSNADRIRSMTDEELAWLFVTGCEGRICPSYSLLSNTEEEAAEHCWLYSFV